ncbi:T9SS type A sorting domain-containing protein [uncultured Polaribacter sp.]|uniref:T9SS type A sorting domain-containing protein n=1 Tax=uncultured Polaribacter sp. TaxID=174711 RepID=UPI002619080B|nr:T9SS type A sorting domain-containing protein [uncultured Polaribacter sp.]
MKTTLLFTKKTKLLYSLLFLCFFYTAGYAQTELTLNGTADEYTAETGDNADAWDMTPPSTIKDNTGATIDSPYKALWNNTDLETYISNTYAGGNNPDEQAGSSSDGTYNTNGDKTRGLKIYDDGNPVVSASTRRLYQKIAVEIGSEYTFSIDSRSESAGTPSEVFILNEEITTEVGLENGASDSRVDAFFEITNDENPSKGSASNNTFTTSTFTFTATTTTAVIYVRALAAIDASTEVFYDNISMVKNTPQQTITVSVDVSADPGGVNIVTPTVSGNWEEYAATVDPNDANKYSYTFASGVTEAEFVWKVYGTSAGDVQENLIPLVGGGALENNIAAYLPTGNTINTDYNSYCNRKVAATETYVAPTFIFNSFKQVGVTYTELVVTAPVGNTIVMDYSLNNWSEFHGPGAKDNGDGTHTAIVTPESAFEYKWFNVTTDTSEDLLSCTNGNGINTDNNSYANRIHVAGETGADVFGNCPAVASINSNNLLNVKVYPNPANDYIFVNSVDEITNIEVYNLIGKKVANSYRETNRVDISKLSKGIYIVKVISNNLVGTRKVIIE